MQVASVMTVWNQLQPDYAANMWNEALNKRLGTKVYHNLYFLFPYEYDTKNLADDTIELVSSITEDQMLKIHLQLHIAIGLFFYARHLTFIHVAYLASFSLFFDNHLYLYLLYKAAL